MTQRRPGADPSVQVQFTKRELAEWMIDQQKKSVEIFHGREIIRAQTLPSGRGTLVVQGRWEKPGPRMLQLGMAPDSYPPADGAGYFPPISTRNLSTLNFKAGILDVTGSQPWYGTNGVNQQLACVLEYGSGSAINVVYCDWIQGVYNLPPCEFVRVSALAWGNNWGGDVETTFLATAAVLPGFFDGAHVPTITGERAMTVAQPASLLVPNGARAVDIVAYTNGAFPTGKITVAGAATMIRDYGTNTFVPGWSPQLIQPMGDYLYVLVDSDLTCRLTYYLEL